MKIIFPVLISLMAISAAISIGTNDYCIRVQNQCKGEYDSSHNYEIKCQKTKCEGKLSYKCGSDYCAENKRSCDVIFNLMFLLRSYKGLLLFEKELEKYTNFIQKINHCSVEQYTLKSEDVCLNGGGCYSVSGFSFRMSLNKVSKSIDCPCRGNHSYHCGEKYCTAHSDACEALNRNGLNVSQNCGNSNQVIKEKFSLF